MKKHKSTDYKLSAVEYYLDNEDLSLRDTCNIYKCSKYSLVRWVSYCYVKTVYFFIKLSYFYIYAYHLI